LDQLAVTTVKFAGPVTVRCSNCSGGSDALALAALVVAVVGTGATILLVLWTRTEHREFLRRLRARARLRVTLEPLRVSQAPDQTDPLAIMAPPHVSFELLLQVGVANDGDGPAGHTALNVLVPQATSGLTWCNADGGVSSPYKPALHTAETLTNENGAAVPAMWINQVLPRVSTRTPVLVHFKIGVAQYTRRIPIRVKAQCDEDERFEEVAEFDVKVHDDAPPYALRSSAPPPPI